MEKKRNYIIFFSFLLILMNISIILAWDPYSLIPVYVESEFGYFLLSMVPTLALLALSFYLIRRGKLVILQWLIWWLFWLFSFIRFLFWFDQFSSFGFFDDKIIESFLYIPSQENLTTWFNISVIINFIVSTFMSFQNTKFAKFVSRL